jgi:hypothetical protein
MYTLRPSTSFQMPNIELRHLEIELGLHLMECGRSTIAMESVHNLGVLAG